jgi:hypothetical protein
MRDSGPGHTAISAAGRSRLSLIRHSDGFTTIRQLHNSQLSRLSDCSAQQTDADWKWNSEARRSQTRQRKAAYAMVAVLDMRLGVGADAIDARNLSTTANFVSASSCDAGG